MPTDSRPERRALRDPGPVPAQPVVDSARWSRPPVLLPVLGLVDRLPTRSRLLLLVAVLLVPALLATGSFAVVIEEQVRFAEDERAGVRVVAPAVEALADSAAGRPVDLEPLRAAVAAHPQLDAEPALRAVERAAEGPGRTAALADLVAEVGDSSNLILDPDLDSFYVMDALVVQVPRALEALGTPPSSEPGDGTSATAAAYQAGLFAVTAEKLESDVATAVRHTADRDLDGELEPVRALGRQLLELAGSTGPGASQPGSEAARARAVEGAAVAADVLAAQLDSLLERRVEALSRRRDVTLALTTGGLLLAVWIGAAVIWRTRHDVSMTLAGVAAISDGDLQERPLPEGPDEFGDIGRAVLGARQRLEGLLFRDPLTGLPNRRMFLDRLQRALGAPDRDEVTVLFLDLDRFKAINDRLGHAAGDELLRAAARRMRECTRPEDTAARLGGDEFAVVLVGLDEQQARRVAERIVAALREPFPLSGGVVHVGVAVGIARAHGDVDADGLLAEADVALYGAKRDGGGRARLYDPALRTEHLHRLQLEADLHSALPGRQLAVVHQPIVRLDTGAVTAMESLLRWDRPGAGPVPPPTFVGIAETSGLIVEIGRWVLEETCQRLAAWRHGSPGLVGNVNVSARQLVEPAFVGDVEAALGRAGLPGSSLTLEVTESILLQDDAEVLERLRLLRELGVRIALDDFGTGFSCLGHLRTLPVDAIKVDRSFVAGATDGGAPLVRTLIDLGHALGLSTTAEGVETPAERDLLRRLGCHSGQGYLFARPMPARAASEHLRSGGPATRA